MAKRTWSAKHASFTSYRSVKCLNILGIAMFTCSISNLHLVGIQSTWKVPSEKLRCWIKNMFDPKNNANLVFQSFLGGNRNHCFALQFWDISYYLPLKSTSAPAGYAVKAVQFVVNAIHGGHAMRVHADSFLGMLNRTAMQRIARSIWNNQWNNDVQAYTWGCKKPMNFCMSRFGLSFVFFLVVLQGIVIRV